MGLERTPSGGLTHRLRNYLLAGIVVSAPITITLFIVWQILGYVDRTVTPFIPAAYNPASYLPFGLPGIGKLTADTLAGLDLPPIVGLAVFLAIVVVLTNAVVDVIVAWLDPRLRDRGSSGVGDDAIRA